MADIKQYTDEIANAVYGEEVRGSIINALNKVNDDNNKYQAIKNEVVAAKDEVQTAVQEFDGKVAGAESTILQLNESVSAGTTANDNLRTSINQGNSLKAEMDANIQTGNTLMQKLPELVTSADQSKDALAAGVLEADSHKSALEESTSTASATNQTLVKTTDAAKTEQQNLVQVISAAATSKQQLGDAVNTAENQKSALDQSILNGKTGKNDLDSSITTAGTTKQQLDDSKVAADLSKKNLDESKTAADTSKIQLDGSIKAAGTTNGNLDQSIQTAGTTNETLTSSIAQGNQLNTDLQNNTAAAGTMKNDLTAAGATATEQYNQLKGESSSAAVNLEALRSENFNSQEILTGVTDIRAYLGMIDMTDVPGIEVDYAGKSFRRLSAAVGLTAGADFDKFPMYGGRKLCNVADDGTITAWFGDPEYTEDGSNGQVMVYQPKFYYMVCPVNYEHIAGAAGYHLRKANYYVSPTPKNGFRLHPAFYDESGNEVDYFLDSAYEGSIFDTSAAAYLREDEQVMVSGEDKFSSIADARPASGWKQSLTRTAIEEMAKKRGLGWHSQSIKQESADQLLMVIELGMMNTQTAVGLGVVSLPWSTGSDTSSSYAARTGSTASLGNGTGQAESTKTYPGGVETVETASGKTSVKWRGRENPWGNLYRFINGISIHGNGKQGGGIPYICKDFNYAENKNTDNYVGAGFQVAPKSGYISAMGYSPACDWLFIPSECLGNSSLPVGDYTYVTENLNGYRIVRLGGVWSYGGTAGAFSWTLFNGVGNRFRDFGGRLVYVPSRSAPAHDANVKAWQSKMTA